ncbi:MAG TPA: GDSL-type esterase/lipase family protein [Gemmatimonadaceae bacterium]|nr:GDSL-type esterase/lipase family protein [Gemmatimonadaceae bacterium]
MALPFLLLTLVEVGLRLLDPRGGAPLFVRAPTGDGRLLVANPRVSERWFRGEGSPPAPRAEPFLAEKPRDGLRVVALGESSTYGFPYPATASFPRVLADMLRDVLPGRTVEVINLGIPATSTWTMRDIASEVLAIGPDVVVIYAGHNEFYGALGAASAVGGGASPLMVRVTLVLQRFRVVQALRNGIARLRRSGAAPDAAVATFMETIAGEPAIPLGGATYRRGVEQFAHNLTDVVTRLRAAGVPVLVGSLASNLRDQPPLAAPANDAPGAARDEFRRAATALARGDTSAARAGFVRARDMDVVRFRAPSAFDSVVRRVAADAPAVYVPIGERFAAEAPGGMPGAELFLEHVHPTAAGYALIARAFAEALREHGTLGGSAAWHGLRGQEAYVAAMALTRFDSLLAHHTVQTVRSRWPFRAVDDPVDYRGRYRPVDAVDSLALLVSRGGSAWPAAKLALARRYEAEGEWLAAAAELAGLARDAAPVHEEPWRLYGTMLLRGGAEANAEAALQRAAAIRPTPQGALLLARIAIRRDDPRAAVVALERAAAAWPREAALQYQLSLAYGLAEDLPRARAAGLALYRWAPDHPGLREWLRQLGAGPFTSPDVRAP